MKKLSQDRGETLVEVLAAVLVASLSIALLFGGVMASSSIDRSARTSDETFYADLSAAERQEDSESKETMIVAVTNGSAKAKLNVDVYGEAVRSYAKEDGT